MRLTFGREWSGTMTREAREVRERRDVDRLGLEILDGDGRIGGFNFQWAWATRYLAGRTVSASAYADGEARR